MPVNPLALALASGCGYVARGFSGDVKHLAKLYMDGIQYPGFALIDVFSPCVTFNKQNTYPWFRDKVLGFLHELAYSGVLPDTFAYLIPGLFFTLFLPFDFGLVSAVLPGFLGV